jgi:hypothetical protein
MRKPRSVVAVSVGEHDRRRIDPLQARKPIRPAIDHHPRTPLPHQHGAVTEMAARPDLDLAAGSEKGELDAALLPCANVVRSNGLPKKREPDEVKRIHPQREFDIGQLDQAAER